MDGYQTTRMDNFKFYDAVMVPAAGAVPKIGTTFRLRLVMPSPNTPWIGALALGSSGIPLGQSRGLPLSVDPLLHLSLGVGGALGLVGITDASGNGQPAIPLPNNPTMAGFAKHVAAFTLDAAKPLGIGNISNDPAS